MVKQKTIKTEISLTGVGLHTGKEVTMTFKPAPINNGFTFVRKDLEGQPIIEADANYVVNTQRGTNLEKLGVKIQTPEHVLAALVGCDLDNVIIELDASELPIMDGSSKYFVEAIEISPIMFMLEVDSLSFFIPAPSFMKRSGDISAFSSISSNFASATAPDPPP